MRGTPGNNQVNAIRHLLALVANSSRSFWTYPAFFVDPSNVSGNASDSNSGLTLAAPIRTTIELNRRLFNKSVTVSSTITYMSDDLSGTVLDLSGVSILSGSSLTFQGTPQVTHTGGTINGGTLAINPTAPGGGQRQTGHTSDLVAFAPFILTPFGGAAAHPEYIIMSSGANAGSSAWIVNGLGATASLSRPQDASFRNDGVISIGDSYRIQRGSLLAVGGDVSATANANVITFNDFAFTQLGVTTTGAGDPTYGRCSLDTVAISPGVFYHCFLANDLSFTAVGGYLLSAGVWLLTGGNTGDSVLEVTNDTYATAAGNFFSIFCNANGNGNLTIFAANDFPSGIQLQDFPNATAAMIIGSAPPLCTGQNGPGLIWGSGNAGRGIVIAPNGLASVPAAVGSVPSVTGTAGDFAFLAQNGGAIDATGRPWDEVGDVYGPSAVTSWANFAGGAFGFQCHHPATNAHLIGI